MFTVTLLVRRPGIFGGYENTEVEEYRLDTLDDVKRTVLGAIGIRTCLQTNKTITNPEEVYLRILETKPYQGTSSKRITLQRVNYEGEDFTVSPDSQIVIDSIEKGEDLPDTYSKRNDFSGDLNQFYLKCINTSDTSEKYSGCFNIRTHQSNGGYVLIYAEAFKDLEDLVCKVKNCGITAKHLYSLNGDKEYADAYIRVKYLEGNEFTISLADYAEHKENSYIVSADSKIVEDSLRAERDLVTEYSKDSKREYGEELDEFYERVAGKVTVTDTKTLDTIKSSIAAEVSEIESIKAILTLNNYNPDLATKIQSLLPTEKVSNEMYIRSILFAADMLSN